MPHQLHDHSRRDARLIEQRREGVAQRMEVHAPTETGDGLDTSGSQICMKTLGGWDAGSKNPAFGAAFLFAMHLKPISQHRQQRQHCALVVLGRGCAHFEVGLGGVEMNVEPRQLFDFAAPQPGVEREQILAEL